MHWLHVKSRLQKSELNLSDLSDLFLVVKAERSVASCCPHQNRPAAARITRPPQASRTTIPHHSFSRYRALYIVELRCQISWCNILKVGCHHRFGAMVAEKCRFLAQQHHSSSSRHQHRRTKPASTTSDHSSQIQSIRRLQITTKSVQVLTSLLQ